MDKNSNRMKDRGKTWKLYSNLFMKFIIIYETNHTNIEKKKKKKL